MRKLRRVLNVDATRSKCKTDLRQKLDTSMYDIENKSISKHDQYHLYLLHQTSKKTRAKLLWENSLPTSLDLSHQITEYGRQTLGVRFVASKSLSFVIVFSLLRYCCQRLGVAVDC